MTRICGFAIVSGRFELARTAWRCLLLLRKWRFRKTFARIDQPGSRGVRLRGGLRGSWHQKFSSFSHQMQDRLVTSDGPGKPEFCLGAAMEMLEFRPNRS